MRKECDRERNIGRKDIQKESNQTRQKEKERKVKEQQTNHMNTYNTEECEGFGTGKYDDE